MSYPMKILIWLFIGLVLTGCQTQEHEFIQQNVPWKLISGVVPVKSATLHYTVEGKGIPCLVIAHSENYRRLLSQELRNHFQFVFMDLRHDARSGSSLDVSEITLYTYLSDIDAVAEALHLEKFAIFGHSHHAYIAFEYARKYPSKISHLIMVGCSPCDILHSKRNEFWESDATDERKALFAQKWKFFRECQSHMKGLDRQAAMTRAMLPKILYDLSNTPAFLAAGGGVNNDIDVYLHYQTDILKDYDVAKNYEGIGSPIFLALGRYDYLAPYILWDERKEVLPNLSYNLFCRSSHFPMFEEQKLFDKKLITWIEDRLWN